MKNLHFLLLLTAFLVACRTTPPPGEASSRAPFPCTAIAGLTDTSGMVCGTITVPENHDEPDGRQIEIAYVILRARADSAQAAYPLIHLAGGPGGAQLFAENIEGWRQLPIRESRDIILLDQRGIGLSSGLPHFETAYFEIMAADLTAAEEEARVAELLATYQDTIQKQGGRLEYYNTFQNAHDVGALMKALGYARYNLFGTSYGTRLGRVVQDLYPEYLNAVILDAPNPLRGDMLLDRLHSYSLALERLFTYCAGDSTCRAEYPNLRQAYLEAIARVAAEPLRLAFAGEDFYLNAQDALYLIRRRLYASDSRTAIPAMIRELRGGGGPTWQETITMDRQLEGMVNFSMWLSVERYEMYDPAHTGAVITAAYDTLPLLPARMGYFDAMYQGMADWHDARLPDAEKAFASSAVPTLILVNHYDPVTPPENGYILMEKLSNGQLFILDEGGHGGGDLACQARVMDDFMNDPGGELDVSCLNLYEE